MYPEGHLYQVEGSSLVVPFPPDTFPTTPTVMPGPSFGIAKEPMKPANPPKFKVMYDKLWTWDQWCVMLRLYRVFRHCGRLRVDARRDVVADYEIITWRLMKTRNPEVV